MDGFFSSPSDGPSASDRRSFLFPRRHPRTHQADDDKNKDPDPLPGSFAAQRAFPGLGEGPAKSDSDFPDLGAAAKAPARKKKGQKMSLADFDALAGGGGGGAYRAPGGGGGFGGRGGGDIVLPTGPSARDPEEDSAGADGRRPGQLGGAFADYGGDRGRGGDRYSDRDDRRGGDRYGDRYGDRDDRRGGFGDRRDRDEYDPRDRDDREPDGPSRADADDNWGRSKAPARRDSPPRGRGSMSRFDDRRGGDRDRYPSRSPSPERDWGALRNRAGPPARDDRDDRRGGFRDDRDRSPSPERDWGNIRNRPGPPPRDERDERGPRPGARADAAGDRWGKSDAPLRDDRDRDRDDRDRGGRPRLVLKARSKDAPVNSAGGGGGGGLFGGARPREAALQEAGRDFIKEDLALSRGAGVRRKKHADERAIEDDIAKMREELDTLSDEEAKRKLTTTIGEAETALAKLSLELDDKVRFSQRSDQARERDLKEGEEKEGGGARRGGQRGERERDERERAPRERDLDRGWGEGKAERGGGGRGGGDRDGGERGEKKIASAERAPRAPRVLKAAEPEAVKIAPSGFAALAIEDE